MLTLRRSGLSSPAYRDWLDYVIVEDGRDVGRVYEDRHSRTELRWFWSITVYVNPKLGIATNGRAASLERGQGAIPGELGTVPPRLDSCATALLSRFKCPSCVRVSECPAKKPQ